MFYALYLIPLLNALNSKTQRNLQDPMELKTTGIIIKTQRNSSRYQSEPSPMTLNLNLIIKDMTFIYTALYIHHHSFFMMSHISYVYMNFFVMAFLLFFLAEFLGLSIKKGTTITKYHDTISSFCASKGTWENKFLLIFTLVSSFDLMFLHFEEFNSREVHNQEYVILFILEIVIIFLFSIVGILYTQGNNPSDQNETYESAHWKLDIRVSAWLHAICALLFLVGLTGINLGYAIMLNLRHPGHKWSIIMLIWNLFNILVGIAFITVQCILFVCDDLVIVEEGVVVDTTTNVTSVNDNYVTKMMKLNVAKRLQTIRIVSFVLECFWVGSVIFIDGVSSVRRNKLILWFD